MKTKKTRVRRDPDYSAAWSACGKPLPGDDPTQNDLRPKLDGLLKAGWSIQAIKEYSMRWSGPPLTHKRLDHITPAVWRWGIHFASEDRLFSETGFANDFWGAATFLRKFNERNAPTSNLTVQAVSMAT